MRRLYHFALSPFSRKVRIALGEKKLDFELVSENYWERRREFLAMNPAAQVPVLIDTDGNKFAESTAICEYLEDVYSDIALIGKNPSDRAEVRRLAGWFNSKFYYEVTKYVVDEKVIKFLRNQGAPDSGALAAANSNIRYHLDYIVFLTEKRKWLAGDKFSLADITAASHLSVLDFLGAVPWDYNPQVKEWYALIKSRPSFRPLLEDKIMGFKPPSYYTDLDF